MNDDDDKLLADYDLSAWEVPPPPAGIADAVIERAQRPAADAVAPPRRNPIRWWIAGGIAAALVASVAAIGLWGIERAPADSQGEISASSPRALDLGTSSATLDAGASVAWARKKSKITATQSRGAATWRVGEDDTLVIDAGAMVASVEATGASLRVEVDMNRTDVRALGISGATAVAVALVTVIVYEGHVKVASNGQTVNVAPGATMQFPVAKTPQDQFSVGADLHDLEKQTKEINDALTLLEQRNKEIEELKKKVDELQGKTVDKKDFDFSKPDDDKQDFDFSSGTCDEVSCILNSYAGACCAKYKKKTAVAAVPPTMTPDAITRAMQGVRDQLKACSADFDGKVTVAITVQASGQVSRVEVKGTDNHPASLATCIQKIVKATKFEATSSETKFLYPLVYKSTCDAVALKQKGEELLATGNDAAALMAYESSLACKADPLVVRLAYLAACRAKDEGKAKAYFPRLPKTQQAALAQLCIRNGIDVMALTAPPCDAAVLKQKGEDHLEAGMDAAALMALESSLKCKQDGGVERLAFLAACRSKQAAKAKYYFPKLPADQQEQLAKICVRSGIEVRTTTAAPAPACDAAALKQLGEDNFQKGLDAAALFAFEKSLQCKQNSGVERLAFLAACRSKNEAKAKYYFPKLPAGQQAQLQQICVRSGIIIDMDTPPVSYTRPPKRTGGACQPRNQVDPFDSRPVCVDGRGTLAVSSKPPAKIFIDGADTGKITPAKLELSPGRHKVTFQVDGDKYTYAVVVEDGETARLVKDFSRPE